MFFYLFFINYQIDNHELAISLYKRGIQELETAMNITVDPNGKKIFFFFLFIQITDNRAVDLHTKMRRHLHLARERVEALRKLTISFYINSDHFFSEKLIKKDRPSPPPPPPKANTPPTKVQRPIPPRNIASRPSVSIT